jgi:hypothetical protein
MAVACGLWPSCGRRRRCMCLGLGSRLLVTMGSNSAMAPVGGAAPPAAGAGAGTAAVATVHELLDQLDSCVLADIVSRLDNRSFCAAVCTCRSFAVVASSDATFEAISRLRWAPSLLGLSGGAAAGDVDSPCSSQQPRSEVAAAAAASSGSGPYPSWRSRVLDDNRRHALPTLDFRQLPGGGLCADWLGFPTLGGGRDTMGGLFYRCKVLALQWHPPAPSSVEAGPEEAGRSLMGMLWRPHGRKQGPSAEAGGVGAVSWVLHLYFDAWGERDLRDPMTSTLQQADPSARPVRVVVPPLCRIEQRQLAGGSARARGCLVFPGSAGCHATAEGSGSGGGVRARDPFFHPSSTDCSAMHGGGRCPLFFNDLSFYFVNRNTPGGSPPDYPGLQLAGSGSEIKLCPALHPDEFLSAVWPAWPDLPEHARARWNVD